MINIIVLVIAAVMCVCAHADGKDVSFFTISTTTEVIPDNANGSQLRNQFSELTSMINAKRFAAAENLANKLRRAYEAEFNTQLKQYSFQSQAEFDEFRKTSTAQFEWIDWGYQACLHSQAFIKSERRDFVGALEILNYVEQVAPFSAVSIAEKGQVLNKLGKYEEALSEYRKALELSVKYASQRPHRAAVLRGMGFALIELKRLDEGERVFQESLEIEPKNQLALNELTYIQDQREKMRGSKDCCVSFPNSCGNYRNTAVSLDMPDVPGLSRKYGR